MRSLKIESANGRSTSEEVQTAMYLLDDATISYSVNILVADADEDAATGVFHSARLRLPRRLAADEFFLERVARLSSAGVDTTTIRVPV
jgi:hypothetical protein